MIQTNTLQIIGISLVFWFLVLQILSWITKFNILRVIVLIGTFALAMAFAGNDLVNFIGVPLAGFESFKMWVAADGVAPTAFLMDGLAGKVKTPTVYLLIAGLIMVVTLWTSKKSRTVTETEINLARQDAGYERFSSTGLARVVVRGSLGFSTFMNKLLPGPVHRYIEKRFEPTTESDIEMKDHKGDHPHFDLVRASVNLTVASILISFATSLKLPLSTTYVTFMVAMGTSLSDKAWGRESAVYRITGVFSVIGGWFLTAVIAFTSALIIAFILYYGQVYAVFGLVGLIIFLVYRSRITHKKVVEKKKEETESAAELMDDDIATKATNTIAKNLHKIVVEFDRTILGLEKEDLKELRKAVKSVDKMTQKTKYLKDNIRLLVDKMKEDSENTAYYFVQVIDYMREALHSISFVVNPSFEHVNNNHKPLIESQLAELRELKAILEELIGSIDDDMVSGTYEKQGEIEEIQLRYAVYIEKIRKNQIKRVKNAEVGTRNTMLFLNIVNEMKNLSLQIVNLYKSQRDFVDYKNGNSL